MKAIRIPAWGETPAVETLPDPVPRPGRTIVRMAAATVGHIDRTVASGEFMSPLKPPYVPGVEAAGTVISGTSFAVGQRVWVRGGGLGTRIDGTWCELIDAPDAAVSPLPDSIGMEVGSAFFSPCASAWVALHEIGRLEAGQRVAVTGPNGAVGSVAVQLAREIGATVVDSPGLDQSVDLLVDTVGGPVLQALLPAVATGGRVVLVGYTAGDSVTISLPWLLQRDVRLLPLNMYVREDEGRDAAPGLFARLADGRISVGVRRFAMAEAALALNWIAQRGHRGRAVITPG